MIPRRSQGGTIGARRAGALLLAVALLIVSPVATADDAADDEVAVVAELLDAKEALADPTAAVERAQARSRVIGADVQAARLIDRVQTERLQTLDLIEWHDARTSARVTRLSIAAGVLAAGSAIGTAMTLDDKLATAGNWVAVVSGAIGAMVTVATALPLGGPAPAGIQDDTLAPLFARQSHKPYPPIITRYLATASPSASGSRASDMFAHWRSLGWISGDPSNDRESIVELTTRARRGSDYDAGKLSIRARMLSDLSSELVGFHVALFTLLSRLF